MVTDRLLHAEGHRDGGVAFSLEILKEALEQLVDIVGVGILGLDCRQET